LITGDPGTGKELIARTIHQNSLRKEHPFVVCNGALLNPDSFDEELFGIVKSDGSVVKGFFEKADKGTLLIDNISDVPLETQGKILRILTEQKFRRIGDNQEIFTNARVLTSSSKNLREEINLGNFREDFYQRIAVVNIHLPRLKERYSDIPLLFNYFSEKISKNHGKKPVSFKPNLSKLYQLTWKGNIRELRNLVERIIILSDGSDNNIEQLIEENIILDTEKESVNLINLDSTLKLAREQFEREYLNHQLKKNALNISKTAESIGMERSALHRKLTALGIVYK
jgi:two-component system nitrogen regulation response regulator NtrX